jgi:hypothetical protein
MPVRTQVMARPETFTLSESVRAVPGKYYSRGQGRLSERDTEGPLAWCKCFLRALTGYASKLTRSCKLAKLRVKVEAPSETGRRWCSGEKPALAQIGKVDDAEIPQNEILTVLNGNVSASWCIMSH